MALILISAMSFAAVSITVTPNNVDFGKVSIKGKTKVEGSVTFDVTYSGLQQYCGVFFEDVTMPADGASFWIEGTASEGYIYGGDEYNEAEGAGLTLNYYADKAGSYTGKIRFFSYTDANWTVESSSVYLTIQLVVTADAIVDTTTPFERVNTTSDLHDGDVIVFVNESAGAVTDKYDGTYAYIRALTENVTVNKTTGKADVPTGAQMFTAKKYSGNWQFTTTDTQKRLHYDVTGSGAFTLAATEAGKILANWAVDVTDGVATVYRPNNDPEDLSVTFPVRFNNDRFKPYNSGAGADIAIYKKAGEAQEIESKLSLAAVDFGEVEQDEQKDVTVAYTAEHIDGEIVWSIEGADKALFSVSSSTSASTVTVKYLGTGTKTGALDAKVNALFENQKLDLQEENFDIAITLIPATIKLTNITFNGAPTTIDQGQTIDMSQYLVFTPSNAENKSLEWTVDKSYQATVDADGKLTAKKVTGTVTVTATSVRVPSVSASTTLTIVKPTITDFTLSDTEVTLGVGGTKTISVTAFVPSYASENPTFASADETVAKVNSNGLITAKAIGETDITATIGEVVKTCKVKVIATSVESIVLPAEATLTKGSSLQLTPVVTPAQAATDHGITYASNNEEVATVSEEGLVKGIAAGEATITATCDGISVQIAIHVVEPALFAKVTDPITLAEKDTIILATIYQGNGVIAGKLDGNKLTALTSDVTVTEDGAYADNALRMVLIKINNKTGLALQPIGSTKVLAERNNDLSLENTTSTKNLMWEFVADENKGVYVHNLGNSNAYFKYHATNKAIKPYKAGTEGAVYVYVYVRKHIMPTDFTLSKEEVTLYVGGTETLSVTAFVPSTAVETPTYASSNKNVATVSASGKITAKAIGEAEITATIGEVVKTCKVSVVATPVESIEFDVTEKELAVGGVLWLEPTIEPTQAEKDHEVTYESSNPDVATVDAEGKVSAIAEGETIITVTCDNKSATIKIIVVTATGLDELHNETKAQKVLRDGHLLIILGGETYTAIGTKR